MKTPSLALASLILAAAAATTHAQGTIQFLNSVLSPILYDDPSIPGFKFEPAPAGIHVGVFWGTDAGGQDAITGWGRGTLALPTAQISGGGVWNGGAVYPILGTQEGQRIWLKIAAWEGGSDTDLVHVTNYGESQVVSVILGPTAGPGTVVWQRSSGTATDRAKPFVMAIIPEPSVWSISALGLAAFLLCRRKSNPSVSATNVKKIFLTLAIVAIAVATQAQGTIQFLNSALSRLLYQESLGGPISTALPAGTHVGAYWGTDAAGAAAIAGPGHGMLAGPTSFTAAGGLWPAVGAPGGPVYPVAGSVEGQRVWLKIAAWVGGDAQSPTGNLTHYGESTVVSVVLGPTAGPGTVVWQGASGTAMDRMKPFVIGVPGSIPEPSVWSISALGLVAFVLYRRKSKPSVSATAQ